MNMNKWMNASIVFKITLFAANASSNLWLELYLKIRPQDDSLLDTFILTLANNLCAILLCKTDNKELYFLFF